MAKAYLQMKYHPAKKEVEFRRFENGKELPIKGGILQKYMDKKGLFVLQDQGNVFFNDIAKAFDSIKSFEIKVITTKIDYDDFREMVDRYNNDPEAKCKITPTLIAELPDMKQTFKAVANFGEQAVGILETHRKKLFDIKSISKKAVKESAANFATQIDKEAKNIKEKIESMSDNKVSLCFTGVYSAGKSALINSILGYKILPESITSKTAKMFQISSPKDGETVQIIFDIYNDKTILEWEASKNSLEFKEGPHENYERAQIQTLLNKLKEDGKGRHEQIYAVLDFINGMTDVTHDIEIIFPIPLDNDAVQFTIYDTPGTDSNYNEHQKVLLNALSIQTQSILIFVAAPNKTEGKGNKALLKYLREAESNNSKTSIDLGRSLFVINWSDSIDKEQREELQTQAIKYTRSDEDDRPELDCSIKLSDKKLFFTSAKYAYAAKAKRNGIASKEENAVFNFGKSAMQDEYWGYLYKQNRCATSELATENMHSQCEKALECARKEQDDSRILEICSGIYALEREIINFGEKYASAVKAYAIIDSVNRALSKLSIRANSLRESNQEQIQEIARNIEELKTTIDNAIDEEYKKKVISENDELPEDTLKQLTLDSKSIDKEIIKETEKRIEGELKEERRLKVLWKTGKIEYDGEYNETIQGICNDVVESYKNDFLERRKELLKIEGNDFFENVKQRIMSNGEISDAAKAYFVDIPKPKIPEPEKVEDLSNILEENTKAEGWWIFKSRYLNKEQFIKDIREIMLKIVEKLSKNYRKDYKDSLETILMQIKTNFESNLEEYSIHMKALVEDKDAMNELGMRVDNAAKELRECENELDGIIWEEV